MPRSTLMLLQLLQEAELRQQSLAAIMLQATPKPKPKPKKVAPRLPRVGLREMPRGLQAVYVFPNLFVIFRQKIRTLTSGKEM